MSPSDPQQAPTRAGQVMIAIGFVIGIALLTRVFDGLQHDQINPNQSPRSAVTALGAVEVYLERNRQGHYIMSGLVNHVPTEFILDTGATDVVIPETLARQAGLEYGIPSQAMTANGYVEIYNTIIPELRLDQITLLDVRASINPSMPDDMALLGMSALRQVEILQHGSQLTLRHYPR